MSADASRDTEETTLIRELSTNYKYTEAPTANRLTNLRDLTSFLTRLRLVFNRFPGVSKILYQTVAATNPTADLKAKSLPERPIVKIEPGTTADSEEQALLQILSKERLTALKAEMTSTGPITTMRQFRDFMADTSFSDTIDENPTLLYFVAPFLKDGGTATNKTIATILDKHMSLEYERNLVLAKPETGYVVLSDTTGYVLPAQDRVTFGDGIIFLYMETGLPESKLHRLLRPYVWNYLVGALSNTPYSHFITECKLRFDVTHVVQELVKKSRGERYEVEQAQAIVMFRQKLWKRDTRQTIQFWLSTAYDEAEKINEITRTYKSEDLSIINRGEIHMFFKLHADKDGYREASQRVARDNAGLVPMDKLLREIELQDTITTRDQLKDSFASKHKPSDGAQQPDWHARAPYYSQHR